MSDDDAVQIDNDGELAVTGHYRQAGGYEITPLGVHNPHYDDSEPVHAWFGLTYSNYLVLHRTLMQSMPGDWQRRMVECLVEMRDAFEHIEQPDGFKVQPAVPREPWELNDGELRLAGVTRDFADPDDEDSETVHYDEWATELDRYSTVMVPVRHDPVPHYQRGRARVEPWPERGEL